MTTPQLREAYNLLSPSVVFLSETKNRDKFMESVSNILHFDHSIVVDSMNRSGGMALFWKQEVSVIEIKRTTFTIEPHIADNNKQVDWWLIGIYASCDAAIKKNQWKVEKGRKRLWETRWIIV